MAAYGIKIGKLDIFIEFNGVTRGLTFIDWVKDGQDYLMWIGSIHIVCSVLNE